MRIVADIWRKWKNNVKKKYFLPYEDDEVFPKTPPSDERIQVDQWWEMVTYWKNPKVQEVAKQNASNVLQKECLHRTGRTPFSVLEEEMSEKEVKDPSRLDVWMESRSRGKGIEDDETTADVHGQLTRELSKKPEEERTKEYKDELFFTAMGKDKHGHIRCVGRGHIINQTRSKTMSRDDRFLSRDQEELQKLRDEFDKQKDEMKEMKEEYIREKEKLLMEQEKTSMLSKKLEALLSQFSSISSTPLHGAQVLNPSTSHTQISYPLKKTHINDEHQSSGLQEAHSISDQQVSGDKCKEQAVGHGYNLKVGAEVYLHCHGIPKKIVAKGILMGFIECPGHEPKFCKVGVTKALEASERLVKPHTNIVTIGQAVNKVTQWELVNVSKT